MELVEVAATVSSPLVEVHFHTSAFDRYSFLQESSEAGDADVEINEENLEEVFEGPGTSEIPARTCLLYTSPSPRDATLSRMPSSA